MKFMMYRAIYLVGMGTLGSLLMCVFLVHVGDLFGAYFNRNGIGKVVCLL